MAVNRQRRLRIEGEPQVGRTGSVEVRRGRRAGLCIRVEAGVLAREDDAGGTVCDDDALPTPPATNRKMVAKKTIRSRRRLRRPRILWSSLGWT